MRENEYVPSAESAIRKLNQDLLGLYWRLHAWDTQSVVEINDSLVDAIRLCEQTLALREDFLIAVAGMQGAGKTTLVREIYGLDDSVMGGNLGRGEVVPVVVRERVGLTGGTRLWMRVLADPTDDQLPAVVEEYYSSDDAERWAAATRGKAPQALVVGIDVPASYFGVDGMGFLLLPGYEQETTKNRSWQRRMRLAILASPALVVVTDQDTLAGDQSAVRQELHQLTNGAIRPVVVVTRTEGLHDEALRANIRQRAVQAFGSGVSLDDVVLSGAGDPKYREEWSKELLNRLQVDRREVGPMRASQLKALADGLRGPLSKAFRHSDNLVTQASLGSSETDNYSAHMQEFRKSRDAARLDYEKLISTMLDARAHTAEKSLEEHLNSNGGWSFLGNRMAAWFKARSSQFNRKQNDLVLDIWNDSRRANSERDRAIQAQTLVVNRELPVNPDRGTNEPKAIGRSDAHSGLQATQLADPPRAVLQDLEFIAGRSTELEPSPEFGIACRLLPAVALENLAIVREPLLTSVADQKPGDGGQHFAAGVEELLKHRKLAIYGLGAFLGADLVVDGNIDSIPALAGALQTALFGPPAAGAAAAGASTAAMAAAIGVVGAATAVAVISVADKMAAERDERALAILMSARELTKERMLGEFDQASHVLEDRLDASLRRYLKLDASAGRMLRLQGALADGRESWMNVLDAIERDRDGLG